MFFQRDVLVKHIFLIILRLSREKLIEGDSFSVLLFKFDVFVERSASRKGFSC